MAIIETQAGHWALVVLGVHWCDGAIYAPDMYKGVYWSFMWRLLAMYGEFWMIPRGKEYYGGVV